jgi:VirE-like protein/AAA domain-containing protein
MKVSTVPNAIDLTTTDCDVSAIIHAIKTGCNGLREQVEKIREVFRRYGKEAAREPKKKLQAVLWSGVFTRRADNALLTHTGELCADLDSLNGDFDATRGRLMNSPYVRLMFTSPCGDGLKTVLRVPADATKHEASYRAVRKHILDLTGIQIDEKCKNVSRMCFLSYDPEIYVNPSAIEIEPLPEPERPPRSFNSNVDLSARQRAATELLGPIDWQSDTSGLAQCPGEHLHTTGNGKRDCRVDLDMVPTVHCFHNSCSKILAGINHELRSGIGKAETTLNPRVAQLLGGPPVAPQNNKPTLVQLSTVAMLPIEFIDKPLFQANAFHLLVGKKNAGKGTFLSAIAARFTRGELGAKCNVIWIAAGEDSLAVDVHPRIKAAGGDADRVYCPKGPIPKLPSDINLLRQWISEVGEVGFMVLDPVGGMLPARVNTNLDSDVRDAIAPLNELADVAKCLIVGVRHLKKDVSQGALDSVLGSADWRNIPRAVLGIATDDENAVRHVQVLTGNRLPPGTVSRSFRIVGENVVEGGEPVTKAEFIDGNGRDVDEILRAEPSDSKQKMAELQVIEELEKASDVGEDAKSSDLLRHVAQDCDASERTVRRAVDALKAAGRIRFVPRKDAGGKVLEWLVRLNNPHGHDDQF